MCQTLEDLESYLESWTETQLIPYTIICARKDTYTGNLVNIVGSPDSTMYQSGFCQYCCITNNLPGPHGLWSQSSRFLQLNLAPRSKLVSGLYHITLPSEISSYQHVFFSKQPAREQQANANHTSIFKASIYIISANFPNLISHVTKHY